jgi:hypothetical protein
MAILNQWRQKFTEDKPKTLTTALSVVLGVVLLGWGISTWWSLRPEPAPPPSGKQEKARVRNLAFLEPAAPEKYVVTGSNPFYAPYIAPPSSGVKAQTAPRYQFSNRTNPNTNRTPTAVTPAGPSYQNVELVFKGTLVGNDGKPVALVQDKLSGRSLFLRAGDEVQGGQVTAFSNSALTWEKSGEKVEIKLGEAQIIGQVKSP